MTPKKFELVILTSTLLAGSMAFAQSLGDFARQQRELRGKEARKAVRVYTNDNLPLHPPGEGVTAAAGISASPSEAPSTATTEPAGQPTEQAPAESESQTKGTEAGQEKQEKAEDKKKSKDYWQGRFKSAREQLTSAEEEQRLAEDELNLLQIQQVREVAPDVQSEIGGKIAAKKAEVESKQAATARARKALEDLEKEFKESGAPEDWSKTE